ncbi:MAG TPA: tetratricopeptide repeat protein [Isosphaeraceae bacterium]|nr:tetratricopeptide repeat protein [Isosphaeraceae bacterium]
MVPGPRHDVRKGEAGPEPSPAGLARRLARSCLLLLPLLLAGCQSFSSPLAQWRAAFDGNLFKRLSPEEMADASGPSDSTNLLQRWLTPRQAPAIKSSAEPSSTLILGSNGWRPFAKPAPNPQADAEYQAALKLFQQGKLDEAETAFAKIAKDRKGTPWGENSQYYLAESQFQRKKYVDAHDSYEKLHADYPATEYLAKLVEREYAIAQLWLAQSDPQAPSSQKIPWTGHFDGRLPLIDTQGSGLRALEHVRQNHPTGPLADDAALQIAQYYVKHNDFESAALYYDQFIAEYRKSPYLQRAQLEAIDARMKGYLGPEYDGSGLEKVRLLVRQTMQSFPERQASYEKLYHTLDLVNEAQAEKTFKDGMYYKRIGKVASAEFYLGKIPQRWPNSPWAVKAKTELAQLAKMPRKPSKPSKIIIPPGGNDPFMSAGPMGGMGMGGMGMGGMGMGGMGMMPGGMM